MMFTAARRIGATYHYYRCFVRSKHRNVETPRWCRSSQGYSRMRDRNNQIFCLAIFWNLEDDSDDGTPGINSFVSKQTKICGN